MNPQSLLNSFRVGSAMDLNDSSVMSKLAKSLFVYLGFYVVLINFFVIYLSTNYLASALVLVVLNSGSAVAFQIFNVYGNVFDYPKSIMDNVQNSDGFKVLLALRVVLLVFAISQMIS